MEKSYTTQEVVQLCHYAFNAGVRSEKGVVNNNFNFQEWLKSSGLLHEENEFLGLNRSVISPSKINHNRRGVEEGDVFECASGHQLIYHCENFTIYSNNPSDFLPQSCLHEYFVNLDEETRIREKRY